MLKPLVERSSRLRYGGRASPCAVGRGMERCLEASVTRNSAIALQRRSSWLRCPGKRRRLLRSAIGVKSWSEDEIWAMGLDPSSAEAKSRRSAAPPTPPPEPWQVKVERRWGRLLYSYFNWRQDTWNDLQLFVVLNLVLLGLGAGMRNLLSAFSEDPSGSGLDAAWRNIYGVLVVVFGQELPDATASAVSQLFSLIVAAVGFASFALVLALVEQVVLQVLDANVRQGGPVYETGHILVLSLADNQRDQEVIWKILSQVCLAYRSLEQRGGKCVVVLCQREKLSMEADFRRQLPESQRYGTRFVFRQGLPLIPDDLRQVAASQASATIVISDSSRSPEEADAQAVRVAVLLDELDFPGFGKPDPRTGHIVVEVKTQDAEQLIQYSCSERVMALPTGLMNAQRIARIACNPVVGMVSQQLWSFNSDSQGYLQPTDGLERRRLSQVHRMFPTGLVLGVYNRHTRKTTLNPPVAQRVAHGDMLVMMRPTAVAAEDYKPISEPVPIDLGDWDATSYVQRSHDEVPDWVLGSTDEITQRQAGLGAQPAVIGRPGPDSSNQCKGLYMLPLEYTTSNDEAERVLICGWGSSTFMVDLLKALDEELPSGSEVTLFNLRVNDAVIRALKAEAELQSVEIVGVRGDPLKMQQLRRRIDVTAYKCAICLCDQAWLDPDLDLSNGIALKSQSDMLRLDALVMNVQLNIRKLLEEGGYPDINLVCEKLAFEGVTRFEDRERLPMGICINLTAYAAKLCFQAAYNPMMMGPYLAFGTATHLMVQDAAAFAHEGEELCFWQMQARCLAVSQTLLGSYTIPTTVDAPLNLEVNPWGLEERSRRFVWNNGDNRRKLITLSNKVERGQKGTQLAPGGGITMGALWADGAAPRQTIGKLEVGHIIQANGGRLKGKPPGRGSAAAGEGLTWVSDLTTEKSKSEARTLRRSTSSLRRQEMAGFQDMDEHGRLLDELASKQDHLARK